MTSLALLLWIAGGILLQLGIFLLISFWHHWGDYQILRHKAADLGVEATDAPATGLPPQDDEAEALPSAWQGFREFRIERRVMEDAAQSICSFYLVPADGGKLPHFLPGQFLTFRLDLPGPGGAQATTRCYSLSDAPHPDHYRISVKRVLPPPGSNAPPGRSSSHFHDHLEIGGRLQVKAPAGHFHIDRSNGPVVLIAGGVGITPMLSMLNWCLANQAGREVWLFYGVRDAGELVMPAQLEALAARIPNFQLRFCLSNPQADDLAALAHARKGRVDVELLRTSLPLKPYHFYICGPTPMLESLVPALDDWGVPASRIHFEAFGPASIKRRTTVPVTDVASGEAPAQASNIVVNFARSGKKLAWQPTAGSLLEFAEANGIVVDSGCRAGGCGTCQTTIREGEVSYRQAPDFDPDPGNCLLCVCVPKTNVSLEL